MSEHRTIKIEVYRTPSGEPTCASDFMEGKFCQFMLTRKMGTIEVCGVTDKDLIRVPTSIGFLVPADGCPVWAKESEE